VWDSSHAKSAARAFKPISTVRPFSPPVPILALTKVDLSAAVDVYSDWIDACDTVAKGDSADAAGQTANSSYKDIDAWSRQVPNKASTAPQPEEQYEKDFVDDDEAGMEENYADDDD